MIFFEMLDRFPDFVVEVHIIERRVNHEVDVLKAIVHLAGGTNLRVLEVRISGDIKKYSYYWLDERNELLIGWDNNDHHPHIDTFPHHRHRAGQVEASHEQNLKAVLSYISEHISGRI